MKTLDLIRNQAEAAHIELVNSLQDVSDKVANAGASATRNSIVATYAHALLTTDVFFNVAIGGGAPVLFTSGAAQSLGLEDPNPRNWDALRAASIKTADLNAYGAAVLSSVQTALGKLSDTDRGMAAGLTNHIWRLEETLLFPLPAPDIPALPPAQEPKIRRKRSKSECS